MKEEFNNHFFVVYLLWKVLLSGVTMSQLLDNRIVLCDWPGLQGNCVSHVFINHYCHLHNTVSVPCPWYYPTLSH